MYLELRHKRRLYVTLADGCEKRFRKGGSEIAVPSESTEFHCSSTKTMKLSTLWRRIVDCHWFYSSLTLDADQWEAADAGEREGRGTLFLKHPEYVTFIAAPKMW